jgi:hypothetical protein
LAIRNGIYGSPNKQRIIDLKGQGWSDEDIAEWLNEVEEMPAEASYTREQVHEYLNRQLTTSSAAKLIAMNKGKDLAKFQAEADQHYQTFRLELNAAVATGDAKRLDIAAKHLDRWFQNRLLTNGIGGAQTTLNINMGKSQEDIERDALLQAVKEWLAKTPEAWDEVSQRAREIAQGAMSVPGAIDVAAQPKPEGS